MIAMEERFNKRMDEKVAAAVAASSLHRSTPRRSVEVTDDQSDDDNDNDERKQSQQHVPVIRHSQARQLSMHTRADKVMNSALGANKDVLGASQDVMFNMSSLLDPIQHIHDSDVDYGLPMGSMIGDHLSKVRSSSREGEGINQHGKMGLGSMSSARGVGFHPDLFRADTFDRPDVLKALGTALSVTSKNITKFKDIKHMYEIFAGQVSIIASSTIHDPTHITERLLSWIRYERHLFQIVTEKGLDAASKYHFDLFSLIRLGDHNLWSEGVFNAQVMRDVDHAYPNKSSSFRGASGGDRGSDSGKKGRNGHSKSGGSSKFTGEPCKHHGQYAKHTTADCKDPKLQSSSKP